MNVFGLDGKPLYPITVIAASTAIKTTTGRQIRSNSAKTVYVLIDEYWQSFTPIVSAWHRVPWIKRQYATAEKFYATIKQGENNNTLDPRISLSNPNGSMD